MTFNHQRTPSLRLLSTGSGQLVSNLEGFAWREAVITGALPEVSLLVLPSDGWRVLPADLQVYPPIWRAGGRLANTLLWGRSAVMCGRFRSTCMSQHSQRLAWQNTGCHRKLETYLAIIFRHCVKRYPNNQIRLRSLIYSPAMLIKSLRYRHESSSYPAQKEVPLFTSADQILTCYGGARYRK